MSRRMKEGDVYRDDNGHFVMFGWPIDRGIPQAICLESPMMGWCRDWSEHNGLLNAVFLFNINAIPDLISVCEKARDFVFEYEEMGGDDLWGQLIEVIDNVTGRRPGEVTP